MKKWFQGASFLALLVVLGIYSKPKFCQTYPTHQLCVSVSPTPQPTAVPSAEPTPVPTPIPTPTPLPTPEPTPIAPPVAQCGLRLDGQPVIGIYMHVGRNVDATPKIYNADRCNAVGYTGRQTCPVCPEGCSQREACETELMGGKSPVWSIRNATGTLRVELSEDWFGRIYGEGTGEVQACFPNGKACSEWLPVSN